MRRLLITGGLGFIGAQVVRWAHRRWPSAHILILDKLTYAAAPERLGHLAQDPRVEVVVGDVADGPLLRRALGAGYEGAIHCAAESHVDRSIDASDAFIHTNVLGTRQILEACRDGLIGRLVHVSTDEVYGDGQGQGAPAIPGQGLKGSSPYAASKAGADLLAQSYQRTYGLNLCITRGSNTYGPWQLPEKLMPLAIGRLRMGRPVPLYGDGLQQRDWIHVEDHAAGLGLALEAGEPGAIYHLGGGHLRPNHQVLADLAKALEAAGITLPEPLSEAVPDRPGHDRFYHLVQGPEVWPPGWRPRWAWAEGMAEMAAWVLANPQWWSGRAQALPTWLQAQWSEGREIQAPGSMTPQREVPGSEALGSEGPSSEVPGSQASGSEGQGEEA